MSNLYGRNWNRKEILRYLGHMDQVAGIKLLESADGRERGNRVFQVWNGSGLYFHVLAERALDISVFHYKGIPVTWISPVGEVHPAYYDPRGAGWLRSFQGGLLVTCGLDHFGHPCVDDGEELGLHGRISNISARSVNYDTFWDEDNYKLEISGEVRQASVFGENLILKRRISTQMGSNQIQISDDVRNEGFEAQPHMILYHFNLGFPLVSECSFLNLQVEDTFARDKAAEAGINEWEKLQIPTAGFHEQVFGHVPVADKEGNVHIELKNPNLGLGLRWTYQKTSLPYLFQWKMMGEGTYVVGIEPANCSGIMGRSKARMNSDLPYLEPGESHHYMIEVEIIDNLKI
jgi:hypothetical protein